MKYPFWVTGFNAISVSGTPTNAQLDLMLSDSAPNTTIGVTVWSDSAPDVITYPDLIRCRWGKTSAGVPTGDFYYHNGTTWKIEEATAVDGSKLINASVPITKLSPAGGNPYDLIQVNPAGTGFQFISQLPYGQIQDGGVSDSVLFWTAADDAWSAVNWAVIFEERLADSHIKQDQIKDSDGVGVAFQVPYLLATNGRCTWGWADELLRAGSVAPSKIEFDPTASNKFIKVNNTADGFSYATTDDIINKWTSGNLALPTAVGYANGVTLGHPYGTSVPSSVKVYLTCVDAAGEAGYSQGDSIDAGFLNQSPSSMEAINVIRKGDGTMKLCLNYTATVGLPHYTTGVFTTITLTKWNAYVVMML